MNKNCKNKTETGNAILSVTVNADKSCERSLKFTIRYTSPSCQLVNRIERVTPAFWSVYPLTHQLSIIRCIFFRMTESQSNSLYRIGDWEFAPDSHWGLILPPDACPINCGRITAPRRRREQYWKWKKVWISQQYEKKGKRRVRKVITHSWYCGRWQPWYTLLMNNCSLCRNSLRFWPHPVAYSLWSDCIIEPGLPQTAMILSRELERCMHASLLAFSQRRAS